MKYKLLKDLPGLEKGSILSEYGSGSVLRILVAEEGKTVANFFSNEMFEKFFEEIKEPVDSIHWKPKRGDKIWYLDENGNTNFTYFDEDDSYHLSRFEFGNTYRTSQECEKARERRLAEVRLRRTSTFKPDFESDGGGWAVYYDYRYETLDVCGFDYYDAGEVVRYKTREDAEKSIRENREDWMKHFGIEED